jgi:hypothetical protein
MYRLLADVLNDGAMVLECLSPMVRWKVGRVGLLCAGGVVSLCFLLYETS